MSDMERKYDLEKAESIKDILKNTFNQITNYLE